jgi:tRNA U55 pseudouridine synthase TruB
VNSRPSFPDGVLVVDKPQGPTSHDVVTLARRALGVSRIGHTGTLDPMATGVLPLVIGRATRLAQFLTASDKDYEATVAFGRTTNTYDAMGTVTGTSDHARADRGRARAVSRDVRADAAGVLGEEHRWRAVVRHRAQGEGRRGGLAQGGYRHRSRPRPGVF